MQLSAEWLIAIAEGLARSPSRAPRPRGRRRVRHGVGNLVRRATHDPRINAVLEHQEQLRKWSRRADAGLKRVVLGQLELNRRLAIQEVAHRGENPYALREVAGTPAYGRARPRVSVLIPLYNHGVEVRAALTSVAESEFDGSRSSCSTTPRPTSPRIPWSTSSPSGRIRRAILLQHAVNRGLGRTRNDLAAAARGEYVFMLDADNEVYPTALPRLVESLDADTGALFAYAMLEVHADGEPETLRSFFPWEPELLLRGNYIDAMALLRREQLLDLGGMRMTSGYTAGRTTSCGAGRPSADCGASSCPKSSCVTAVPTTRCSRSPTSTAPRRSRCCG